MLENDVIEVVCSFQSGPELGEVVYHVGINAVGAGSNHALQMLNFLNAVDDIWLANVPDLFCATTIWLGQSAKVVKTTGSPTNIFTSFAGVAGEVTGEETPSQSAALCSKYAATAGPSARGRMYLPFVPKDFHESGRLNSSAFNLYQQFFEDLLNTPFAFGSTGSAEGVIYSRKLDAAVGIEYLMMRPVLATQRRRVVHKQGLS